jgi:phospholipid transport system substrate-binding protein
LLTRTVKGWFAAATLGIALGAASPVIAAPEAMPEKQIADFNATLLYIMKNAKKLGFAGRRDAIAPKIEALYSLSDMARISVGPYWRKLNSQQQQTLVDTFTRMTVATYADRFDNWSGESFEIRGTETIRAKMILVKTAIVRNDEDDVPINYVMRSFPRGWRVIDVFLKSSYSELATKRSEYTSFLSRNSFPDLIREMERKITQHGKG